jgi:YlmC/YmxH family sporulation protein
MKDCNTENFREKAVINSCDGRIIGHVAEVIFDVCDGKITAIVVRGECSAFSFKKGEDIVIPWCKIEKIGEDVIIVDGGDFCSCDKPDRKKRRDDCCEL